MGLCSSKTNKELIQSNNNNNKQVGQENNSFHGGSFVNQLQQKSSLIQTPIFHQNTGSIQQQSSKVIIQGPELTIKEGFLENYRMVTQSLDYTIVKQINSDIKYKAYVYKKQFQDTEELINRIISMPLNHKFIIKLIDIYKDEQNYFVLYEHQNMKNLSEYLKVNKLNIESAGIIFNKMIDIIGYLHSQTYCHGAIHLDTFNCIQNQSDMNLFLVQTKNIYLRLPTKITQKNDVQALGLIGFQLLTGHPFRIMLNKSSKWEIKKELNEEFDCLKLPKKISKLIMKMINPIPLHRLSLQQVKEMCWIQNHTDSRNPIGNSFQKLKYIKFNSLTSILTYYIVERFLQHEKQKLTNLFNQYDLDGDGRIDLLEFFQLYLIATQSYKNKKNSEKIYELLDEDDRSQITLQQFLIVAIDKELLLNENVISSSYMSLSNKNGYITVKSINKKIDIEEQQLLEIFSEVTDFERLNFLEYKQLLQDYE
ncbi:unnamed protein product [Paramecium primaurelia]|uniref:Protein kinase-like domain n=1 Tax=Paramecium primaurelia TaxID=5886 RepID=A0A8S1K469_PARPR|nr:unnamed protein product [Paramecium primaurelia]